MQSDVRYCSKQNWILISWLVEVRKLSKVELISRKQSGELFQLVTIEVDYANDYDLLKIRNR